MKLTKPVLTLWLAAPIAAVALLCAWIIISLHAGPRMHAEPVGAGAGQTGGANALGEWIAHRHDHGTVRIIVEDRTGRADADRPLLLSCRADGWQGSPMTRAGDGRWQWQGPAIDLDMGFELLWADSAGQVHRDPTGRRQLRVSQGEQLVILDQLSP
ncbi:MAG: hypothetical protein Kow0022_06160 [Phycisphaerales bacterium]